MKKLCVITLLFLTPLIVYAEKGCCSHHGGVAYCGSNGYYICNDGTQSPSCTCGSIDDIQLTDTFSCDYERYEDRIDELENEISELREQNKDLATKLENEKNTNSNIITLGVIGIVIFFIYIYSKGK